jgi:hypothetical protein
MSKKEIIFIADFYVDQVLGGGELNNEELYEIFISKGYDVLKKQSHEIDINFLQENKDKFFLIFNFINLNQDCRQELQRLQYIIYEHDHKYLKSRNPAIYKNFKVPDNDLINYYFYKNAIKVFCQSNFHRNIVELNLGLDNIESLGGNLWSDKSLELLRELSRRGKIDRCSILKSEIQHKNTTGAIKYCTQKKLGYDLIQSSSYKDFLQQLGRNKKLVFFPRTPETLSRIVVEARMMGMSVVANALIGATSEDWFNLKGEELVDVMTAKKDEIFHKIEDCIHIPPEELTRPEITLLATFCDGERYIVNFLENITSQTVFNKCELIIIDAASSGIESNIIEEYKKRYPNIIHHRIEERLKPTPCINMAAKMANGEYLSFALLDDVKAPDCLESLLKTISSMNRVDLVYGDVLVTQNSNETFLENSSSGKLLENSSYPFAAENMIKCLPGPMPLWRKNIHDKNGFFNDVEYDYADDWEMWLRCVNEGSEFFKLDKIVGLYLEGGRSQQDENIEQRREETDLFYKYSHLFGKNYDKYLPHFRQYKRSLNEKP